MQLQAILNKIITTNSDTITRNNDYEPNDKKNLFQITCLQRIQNSQQQVD